MTYGDPQDMTPEVRAAGHKGVRDNMTARTRALCEASGSVADHRRLVAFIYLLMRDNMPCGKLGEVMMQWEVSKGVNRVHLFQGLNEARVSEFALRLCSVMFVNQVSDWLALVFRHSEHPDRIPALVEMLPASDDTETVFTNGWLAQYAQHIAKALETNAR